MPKFMFLGGGGGSLAIMGSPFIKDGVSINPVSEVGAQIDEVAVIVGIAYGRFLDTELKSSPAGWATVFSYTDGGEWGAIAVAAYAKKINSGDNSALEIIGSQASHDVMGFRLGWPKPTFTTGTQTSSTSASAPTGRTLPVEAFARPCVGIGLAFSVDTGTTPPTIDPFSFTPSENYDTTSRALALPPQSFAASWRLKLRILNSDFEDVDFGMGDFGVNNVLIGNILGEPET